MVYESLQDLISVHQILPQVLGLSGLLGLATMCVCVCVGGGGGG